MEISVKKYAGLLKRDLLLSMLEQGGVDNWEWYSDSLRPSWDKDYNTQCREINQNLGIPNEEEEED